MSKRTGLGRVEVAVLRALAASGALPGGKRLRTADALDVVSQQFDVHPRYANDAITRLMSHEVAVRLIAGRGNFGTRDDPPASPKYTEVRVSPLGVLAIAAEDRTIPRLPLGLMLGTTYADGIQPPLDPARVIDAVLAAVDPDADDATLIALAGPPTFPGGCLVDGDVAALARGERTVFQLSATLTDTSRQVPELQPEPDQVMRTRGAEHATDDQIRAALSRAAHHVGDPQIVISTLPPGIGPDRLEELIRSRARSHRGWALPPPLNEAAKLDLQGIADTWETGSDTVICDLHPGADVAVIEARLREVWGVTIDQPLQYPAPLPDLIRRVAQPSQAKAQRKALTRLRTLIES